MRREESESGQGPRSEDPAVSSAFAVIQVKLAKTIKYSTPKVLGSNLDRGCDSGDRSAKQLPGRCNLRTEYHFSSDISPERPKEQNHHLSSANVPGPDFQAKSSSASHMSKSDPESDEFEGAVSAPDEETMCPSSHLTTSVTDAASGEEWSTPIFSVPLSPKKALRAAMLKSHCADTILKAQLKSLLDLR